jgi:serine/threonine protein kinase
LQAEDDQTAPPEEHAAIGRVFGGRYRVTEKLGEGAFGAVYRGVQLNLQQDVAIKVLKEDMSSDEVQVKRFYNESRVYARINHPHVVTIHDFGQDEVDDTLYLVMEFLEGHDLAVLAETGFTFTAAVVTELGIQMAQGLAAAHEAGIIHRDLKPANVMVLGSETDHPFAQLLDFGISKLAEGDVDEESLPDDPLARDFQRGLTRAGKFAGTPAYMSPEQCMGEALDERTDIYSMGCLLYEMAVGEPPFVADNLFKLLRRHVSEAPVPPTIRNPDSGVTPELETVILRCLEKETSRRYQSAAELLLGLEEAKKSLSGPKMISLLDVDEDTSEEGILPVSRKSFGDDDLGDESGTIVRRILATLSKAYKSFQLYPRDNPVVQEATRDLIGFLETYFEENEVLELTVDRFAIYFNDQRVYEDRDLRNSYPFRMFADGIRRFFFHSGIQPQEIDGYFECLRLVSGGASLSSDLVTLMWERRFRSISYLLIDDLTVETMPEMEDLSEGLSIVEDKGGKGDARRSPPSGDEPNRLDEMKRDLTEAEREAMAELIAQEERADHTGEFVRALFRALVWTEDPEDSEGLVRGLAEVSSGLLHLRDYAHVVPLLQGVLHILPRAKSDAVMKGLHGILVVAGTREHLHNAGDLLDSAPEEGDVELVTQYLACLTLDAIEPMIDLFDQVNETITLPHFQRTVYRLTSDDPNLLKPGLEHPRRKVVGATCAILARSRSPLVFALFEPLLSHESHLIRMTAVRALAKTGSIRVAERLGRMLGDISGPVRAAVMECFVAVPREQASEPLVVLLESDAFADRNRQEQLVLYRVLARVGGEDVIRALARQIRPETSAWYTRAHPGLLALMAIVGLAALPILIGAMGTVGGALVWLLLILGGVVSVRDIVNAQGDKQLVLVEPAVICLHRIGGSEATRILETASRSGPSRVRRICARVIGHRGAEQGQGANDGGEP